MNKICKLFGIKYPIIQEPIHTLTNGKMIASISEAGALGILGINAGYISSDATTGASSSTPTNIGEIKKYSILDTMTERNLMNEEIDTALENTFRPFGIEVASSKSNPNEDPTASILVSLMRKRRLTICFFEGFGNIASSEWVKLFHSNGIRIIQRVTNLEQIKTAIKNKIDVLIADNSNILLQIKNLSPTIPVLAGGDLSIPQEIQNAFKKGADGIFISTIFLVSKEAPIHPQIKQKIVNSSTNDLITIKMNNQIIYSLPGKLPNYLAQLTKKRIPENQVFEKAYRYQGLINGMIKNDLYNGYTSLSKNIDFIAKITSIDNIISTLISNIYSKKN